MQFLIVYGSKTVSGSSNVKGHGTQSLSGRRIRAEKFYCGEWENKKSKSSVGRRHVKREKQKDTRGDLETKRERMWKKRERERERREQRRKLKR